MKQVFRIFLSAEETRPWGVLFCLILAGFAEAISVTALVPTIQAIANSGEWDSRTSAYVLASISEIKSDYYKSEALQRLIKEKHVDNWPSFFNATGTIGSSHYQRETLMTALRQQPLTRDVVLGVLGVATKLRSDHDLSEVLTHIARTYRMDDSVRSAFDRAIDAIDSDHYRGTVLSAMRRSAAR